MPSTMKEKILVLLKNKRALLKVERIIIVALVLAIAVRAFVVQPFLVSGDSMAPYYAPGDYLIIDRLSYRFEKPERGDVVVFQYPLDPSLYLIKRIEAVPGESVRELTGEIVASSTAAAQNTEASSTASSRILTLASDEYFVLGDNSTASSDSRAWGPLQKKFIVGRILFRAWPPSGK
jgi:signal peptidase I